MSATPLYDYPPQAAAGRRRPRNPVDPYGRWRILIGALTLPPETVERYTWWDALEHADVLKKIRWIETVGVSEAPYVKPIGMWLREIISLYPRNLGARRDLNIDMEPEYHPPPPWDLGPTGFVDVHCTIYPHSIIEWRHTRVVVECANWIRTLTYHARFQLHFLVRQED